MVRKSEEKKRTRHLAYPFANAPTHTHDAYLPERVLVEPLGDEFARVLEREVEARRAHVAVRHRRREVQQEDEMADDRTAYRRGRREESEKEYIAKVNVSRGMCVRVRVRVRVYAREEGGGGRAPPSSSARKQVRDRGGEAPRLVFLHRVPGASVRSLPGIALL